MLISIIVAVSTNNVIGKDGGLPWRLPEDLKRFRQVTMGKPMIMGRATWDSIGRALPGRQSIVLTRQAAFTAGGCDIAATVEDALQLAAGADEVMVIGGGQIYRQFLPQSDRIYLTRVNATIEGDTFFPELDDRLWTVLGREDYPVSGEREHAFEILTLERRDQPAYRNS
jgi:dihydrofolate reductase